MELFKNITKILKVDQYRKNPDNIGLSNNQQVALNIGAINAEQTMCYYDSLETGVNKQKTVKNLKEIYGINGSESAVDTLDWLLNRGYTVCFEAIKHAIQLNTIDIDYVGFLLSEQMNIDQYFQNLNESVDTLIKNKFIDDKKDIAKLSIDAWDMSCLVNCARRCYDLAYISEEQAWRYIYNAYMQCNEIFDSWTSFASSYMIGRAMCLGAGIQLDELIVITKELLKDENSPWRLYLLKE
ncbi:MAG: DUF1266 domain-containing protein [Bacilli bacterium]